MLYNLFTYLFLRIGFCFQEPHNSYTPQPELWTFKAEVYHMLQALTQVVIGKKDSLLG